jgi:hypothetical protein
MTQLSATWSDWRPFPDPTRCGVLVAPLGPGCYELRHGDQLVLFGKGGHVAQRMSSLLPRPWGCGTRNNSEKRLYVRKHLPQLEYRTLGTLSRAEATAEESRLTVNRAAYLFPT